MTRATPSHEERLSRARLALEGLSLGDAFGQCFFGTPTTMLAMIAQRAEPRAPWVYTDDTEMALALYDTLRVSREVERDVLARAFTRRYGRDPDRKYGGGAHLLLCRLLEGAPWREASRELFDGQGSFGNGGAMRVAPVAGYYAHDLPALVEAARASAEVTHAHPEGQAGAVAAAVAGAWAWQQRCGGELEGAEYWETVLAHTPPSSTRATLETASRLGPSATLEHAVRQLGNGARVSSMDTVPLALWCARRHLGSLEEALWFTVEALGDRDTTCAIVGGIVALFVGDEGLPRAWLAQREELRFDAELFR